MQENTQEAGPMTAAQMSIVWPELLITQIADAVAARLGDTDRRNTSQSPWLDVDGAAAYLNTTSDAVRKAAQRGQLPGHQPNGPGSRWFFHRDELDRAIRGSHAFDLAGGS
jgi:excisionase family DNA binding protein